ncbi:helix-turn-helix domain-containing protein, partial [Catenulispora rubra]|uniref:helix-turn-helix domain-containing protein n=1 Tax=Catenulispora rubra TaxID=280293 RepID=UPI002B27233B
MGETARVNGSPVACVLLAEELRTLRKRAGLSFAALGAQTLYSKSSWSRYLNGEVLPPWQAVQALCGLAGEPEPRLRAMWKLAEQEWSRRDAVGAGAAGSGGAVGSGGAGALAVDLGTMPQTAAAAQVGTGQAKAGQLEAGQLEAASPTSVLSTSPTSPSSPTSPALSTPPF